MPYIGLVGRQHGRIYVGLLREMFDQHIGVGQILARGDFGRGEASLAEMVRQVVGQLPMRLVRLPFAYYNPIDLRRNRRNFMQNGQPSLM